MDSSLIYYSKTDQTSKNDCVQSYHNLQSCLQFCPVHVPVSGGTCSHWIIETYFPPGQLYVLMKWKRTLCVFVKGMQGLFCLLLFNLFFFLLLPYLFFFISSIGQLCFAFIKHMLLKSKRTEYHWMPLFVPFTFYTFSCCF